MPGVKGVVAALTALGEAAETAVLPQGVKPVLAPGEQLVGVGLMPHIPDDLVPGAVKDIVEGDGQIHHSQAGGQVASGFGHGGDDLLPDFLGQLRQEFRRQLLQLLGIVDSIQQTADRNVRPVALAIIHAHLTSHRWVMLNLIPKITNTSA